MALVCRKAGRGPASAPAAALAGLLAVVAPVAGDAQTPADDESDPAEEGVDGSAVGVSELVVLGGAVGAVGAIAWHLNRQDSSTSSGGGGSDDGTDSNLEEGQETLSCAEFDCAGGLVAINAKAAYDNTITGDGVTVAVADTGLNIDHSEFDGRLDLGASANYYDPDNDYALDVAGAGDRPVDRDNEIDADRTGVVGHGTHVAGIVAANDDGQGMHGVAPDATIAPFAVLNEEGTLSEGAPREIIPDYVERLKANDIAISNNSWGSKLSLGDDAVQKSDPPIASDEEDAWDKAVTDHGIAVVWAAGNVDADNPTVRAGLPYFDGFNNLASHWLAVAALGSDDKTIAHYSNHCGKAKDWCLAAPGTAITSSNAAGNYSTESGTSMAAPHASGALALLLQANNGMTASEAVAKLLATADDSFDDYNAAAYGQGRLDIEAALQKAGALTLSSDNSTYALAGSKLAAGPAVGDGLRRSLADLRVLVRDAYSATFYPSADLLVAEPAQDGPVVAEAPTLAAADPRSGPSSDRASTAVARVGETRLLMGTRQALVARPGDSLGSASSLSGRAARDGHASLLGRAQGLAVVRDLDGTAAQLRADVLAGRAGRGESAAGLGARVTLRWDRPASTQALRLGVVAEDGRLLGGTGAGATALGGRTGTVYTGLQGSRALPWPGWRAYAQAQLGISRYHSGGGGVVRDSTPIATSRAGVGLGGPVGLGPADRLAVAAIQPLRVESGALRLELPWRADRDGSTGFRTRRAGLTPSGREISLRARYRVAVPEAAAGRLALGASLSRQPRHRGKAATALGGGLHYRVGF